MQLAPLALLLALSACKSSEDELEITGACLYAAQDPLVAACVNQFNGGTTCQTVGGQSGDYQAGDGCGERGYERPCTYDLPWTLWIADGDDQVIEDAACDAWMSEEEG